MHSVQNYNPAVLKQPPLTFLAVQDVHFQGHVLRVRTRVTYIWPFWTLKLGAKGILLALLHVLYQYCEVNVEYLSSKPRASRCRFFKTLRSKSTERLERPGIVVEDDYGFLQLQRMLSHRQLKGSPASALRPWLDCAKPTPRQYRSAQAIRLRLY